MAGVLPRSKTYALGLPASIGPGPFRSGESGDVLAPRRSVDLWAGGRGRAPRRRRRCRVSLRIHDRCRWRHTQHLLRSRRLRDRPGADERSLAAGMAGRQWKFRAAPASAGLMKALRWILQLAFGCRHRHLSRVFTIKHRTYQVYFDCAQQFDLPDAHGPARFNPLSGRPLGDEASPCTAMKNSLWSSITKN